MLFKKIDASSTNTVSSALSFFETPPSNVGIAGSKYREILPLNPVAESPIQFKIFPGSNFLDLSHIFLETKLKIVKLDATTGKYVPIADDEKIATIQGIGSTWIKNLRVTINGRETFNSNSLYAYKSYMDMELSFSREVKSTYLGIGGYFPLKETEFNQDASNECYTTTKALFAGGKTPQFYTRLNADIFSSDLLMINNVAIEIEIHPHDSDFLLMDLESTAEQKKTRPTYKLVVDQCKLYCKYVELMDGVALEVAKRLESSPARYGVRRSELRSHFISYDRQDFQTTLFTEQLPRRIIVGLVEAEAYNGDLAKSPFNFKHFDVEEITIYSGTMSVPSVLYKMDWSNNSYMRCYNDLMDAVGMANSVETNGISPKRFKNGWCMFAFNLTSDMENSDAFELIKSGTTSIHIRFKNPVRSKGIHLIAYGEMDSLLMLDRNRTLTTDQTT